MSKLSYRMLFISGAPAGLLGLEELFNALYDANITPDDGDVGNILLQGVRKHNYIPKPAIKDYLVVLKREYENFYSARATGKPVKPYNYGTWRGYPREQIPWFPTVSSELCNGCGACLDLCAHNVYARAEDGKVIVVEPFNCVVGCCFCKSVCAPKAILFPSQELLNEYRPKF